MSDPIIEFQGVSKSYPVYESPADRLLELASLNRIRRHRDFWALQDVSFTVKRGETFCIIGENGSGKSTLLQIIAGIMQPSCGTVRIQGRVSALLELGSGFNPEFSGRDNVFLNASILGLSSKEIERRLPEIEAFAEIGSFIDQPVKTYSSGMIVRLAFAVAIHVDPEILLVDEALAVGDIYFRQRCMRKVHELRSRGITILFVSHAMGDVKAIGDRTMWLDGGRVRELGDTPTVVAHYLGAMAEKDATYIRKSAHAVQPLSVDGEPPPEVITRIPNIDHRVGDGRAEILGIGMYDEWGNELHILQPLSQVVLRITVKAHEAIARPIVGFVMRNHLGIDFAGTNTARENTPMPPLAAGQIFTVDFHLEVPELYPGEFSFTPAICDGTLEAPVICDWIDNALVLQMGHAEGPVYGYLRLPCRVEFNRPLGQGRPQTVVTAQ